MWLNLEKANSELQMSPDVPLFLQFLQFDWSLCAEVYWCQVLG